MTVLPDVKTARSSFIWTKHWSVTDRQTDRRTDRQPVAITAVCIASNAEAV